MAKSINKRGYNLMARKLDGKKVAILVADGFEQVEMIKPREALDEAGAQTKIVSLKPGKIQGDESYGQTRQNLRWISQLKMRDRKMTSWPAIQVGRRKVGR
jgi:putative intracellular protease/amidase